MVTAAGDENYGLTIAGRRFQWPRVMLGVGLVSVQPKNCVRRAGAAGAVGTPAASLLAQLGDFLADDLAQVDGIIRQTLVSRIELTNEGRTNYGQYFHIDYELYDDPLDDDVAYLHAQWRRKNPNAGWGHDMPVNHPNVDVVNLDGRNNYVVLDAKGRGHYIGCNLSVTNLHGSWWGEGDEMIWVDGYKWPPDVHGTGTEDYFNQAWGMQRNAFLFNGSSLYEEDKPPYQVSYVFHLTNPVHFRKSILATIEHGHANQLADEWASTAYWYQLEPHRPFDILPVEKRRPLRSDLGAIGFTPENIPRVRLTKEMASNRKKSLRNLAKQQRERIARSLERFRQQEAALRRERRQGYGRRRKAR